MLNNIKKGFTLAEVVVVLVVMAVVASILMPTLIANNEQRVMVTALKKNFADLQTLQDAINLEEMHHTRCAKLDMRDDDKFINTIIGTSASARDNGLISQYTKTMKGKTKEDYIDKKIKTIYGQKKTDSEGNVEKDSSGNPIFVSALLYKADGSKANLDNIVILKNSVVWLPYKEGNDFLILVDVNGIKSPNKIGRDMFYFKFEQNSTGKWEVVPYEGTCSDLDKCQKGKESTLNCTGCAAKIFDKD